MVTTEAPTPAGELIEPECNREYIVSGNKFSYVAPKCEIVTFENSFQISGSNEHHLAGIVKDGKFYHKRFTKFAKSALTNSTFWDTSFTELNLEGKVEHCQFGECFTWFNIGQYWHWFLEDLPLIKAFRTKPDLPIYVNKLNHYQKESLEYFKDIKERIVEVPTPCIISANKIHVVTYPAISNRGKAAKWVTDFLKENLKPTHFDLFAPKRLYISRNEAAARRVVNEDKVISLLRKYGFVIVNNTSSMTLEEKINMFGNANIVVSPTGANLTHAHAMNGWGNIIDFNHDFEVSEECGWNNIGDACGINWETIPAKTIGPPPSNRNKKKNCDLKIDINILERLVRERVDL